MKTIFRRIVAGWLEGQVEQLVRDKNLKVVAVTGSVGKTSTKLAIAAVLGQKYKVLAQEGNYNTEIGLPLSIFESAVPRQLFNPLAWLRVMGRVRRRARRFDYQVVVLEMGVDHPGEMDLYLRYLKPDIGVVTAIQKVHLEQFKTIEAIAHEKLKLAQASHQALLNNDDPILQRQVKDLQAVTFGTSGDFGFENVKLDPDGIEADLRLEGETAKVKTHAIGEHSLRALEAAAAVGHELGLTPAEIVHGIESYRPFKGRMNPLPGIKGSTIIDDSYNSSPVAAVAALEALYQLPGRHLAILGSMNELGNHSKDGHQQVGRVAAKLDYLVTVGEEAEKYLAPAAIKAGLDKTKVQSYSSPYEAGRALTAQLQAGDVVLCKGSQNRVFIEEAVKQLLADPAYADQLVRQSKDWLKKKQQQFPAANKLPVLSPVKRVTMQSLADQIGVELAIRSCAPVAFYMLLRANGYVSPLKQPDKFLKELTKSELYTEKFNHHDWSRPGLSRHLRQEYGASIVSWAWPYNQEPDLERMKQAGYVQTERELNFYQDNIQGRDIADIVREGNPVIVTMKPGFGANDNRNIHAVVILQWPENGSVVLVDPDVRNQRTEFSDKLVREFISPDGAGTVVLPKP